MARLPLTPEQQTQARQLAERLRPRLDSLLGQLSEHLVANQEAPFGRPEFELRDLLHAAGADALQAAAAGKKPRPANMTGRRARG